MHGPDGQANPAPQGGRGASRQASIALDAFNGLVASVQTGFGPFVAVYLASEAWTQRDIGLALSIGTVAAMISQVPGGAAVDAVANKRTAALAACIAVAAAALLMVLVPTRLSVMAAEVLHGFASCMLIPAVAAISLHLVGRAGLGERLGRNARYAAIGSAAAAAVMGAVGTYVNEASVFYLTAALMVPALLALRLVRLPRDHPEPRPTTPVAAWRVMLDPRLLALAMAVLLFQLSNAAVLPLVAADLTRTVGSRASLIIAACIVLPQGVVALLSPAVGRAANRWGRRPLLVLAVLAVPLRAGLLAVVTGPYAVMAVQTLDGISAAGLGVLLPLVAADLTRGSGRFNLVIGALGLAAGLGATFSTALAGFAADAYGESAALLGLAAIGLASAATMALFVPETQDAAPRLQFKTASPS